jgi:O-antigen ligase
MYSRFNPLVSRLEAPILGAILLYYLSYTWNLPAPVPTVINAVTYAIVIFLIAWRWQLFKFVLLRDPLLLAIVGLTVVSTLWSAAPETTSIEVRALVRSTALGAYLAMRYSIKTQLQLFAWVLGLSVLISLGMELSAFRGLRVPWVGMFSYKNFLAYFMILGASLFTILAVRSRQWLYLGLTAACLLLLALSQGKGGYAIAALSLVVFPAQKICQRRYKIRTALFLIFLAVASSVVIELVQNFETLIVGVLGKDLTFNARLPIWSLMLDKIGERPWLGYGYAGFWTSDEALHVLNHSWGIVSKDIVRFNSHNGYLDLMLQLGGVGLLLYLTHWLVVVVRLVKLAAQPGASDYGWMLHLVAVFTLLNFCDTLGIVSSHPLWSLYSAIAFSTALQDLQIKRQIKRSYSVLIT